MDKSKIQPHIFCFFLPGRQKDELLENNDSLAACEFVNVTVLLFVDKWPILSLKGQVKTILPSVSKS